jgi:hypothetical protein
MGPKYITRDGQEQADVMTWFSAEAASDIERAARKAERLRIRNEIERAADEAHKQGLLLTAGGCMKFLKEPGEIDDPWRHKKAIAG